MEWDIWESSSWKPWEVVVLWFLVMLLLCNGCESQGSERFPLRRDEFSV
jgi:hypothetical protein